MQLDAQQQDAVRLWVAEGATLSEVQRRLLSEYGLSLTYMDARFLLLEIGVTPKDKPGSAAKSAGVAGGAALAGPEPDVEDALPEPGAPAHSAVTVQVDRIMKPGSLVSGKVTFSDGVSASWMLDAAGRLAVAAERKGYTPSQGDVAAFQAELRRALESQGY